VSLKDSHFTASIHSAVVWESSYRTAVTSCVQLLHVAQFFVQAALATVAGLQDGGWPLRVSVPVLRCWSNLLGAD
jgi:hypothetical protein